MDNTSQITQIISLYDSYLLTINTILIVFAIVVALFTLIGLATIRKYIRNKIEKEVTESIDSDKIRERIKEIIEQKVKQEGNRVYYDVQLTKKDEDYSDKIKGDKNVT